MRGNSLLLLGAIVLTVVPLLLPAPNGPSDSAPTATPAAPAAAGPAEGGGTPADESNTEERFAGADAQAKAMISKIRPDYTPWFAPFWEPPSGEIESLLFALQASLGAGLLGYYLGTVRGRSRPVETKNASR